MFRKFFSFFFLFFFFLFSWGFSQENTNISSETNTTNNHTNFSLPPFNINNLTNEGLYIINTNDADTLKDENLFDIKAIITDLVEKTNKVAIDLLYDYVKTNSYIENVTNKVVRSMQISSATNLLSKSNIASYIEEFDNISELSDLVDSASSSFVQPSPSDISRGAVLYLLTNDNPQEEAFDAIDKFSLLSLLPNLDILDDLELLNADNVSLYKDKQEYITNTIIVLRGNVEFRYDQTIVRADEVKLNLKTQDAQGEGNVYISLSDKNVILGERVFLNIKKQQGVVLSAVGRQEKNYYIGKILKFNDKDFYTVENAKVSFSSDGHSFYSVGFNSFEYLGDEDMNATQLIYSVHNHPFLWFPAFLQNNHISTSLQFNFGQNRREGYYLLNNYIFEFDGTNNISPITLNFNLFEKVGTYMDLQQSRTVGDHSYSLFLSGGLYYQNINITRAPLLYSFHDSSLYGEDIRDGYKIDYNHTYTLLRNEEGVNSSVNFKFIQNSNPFFSSIFRKGTIFPEFNLNKLYQRDQNESYYVGGSSLSKDLYSVDYSLTAPSFSIGVSSSWVFDIYEDPEQLEFTEERYISYLKTWRFPNINITHSGAIPLFKEDEEKYFDLGYNLSSSFNGVANYKDGRELGEGSLYTNVEPFEIINSEYNFGFTFGVSKSFDLNPDSNIDDFWYWAQSSISPSVSWSYDNAFEVEKNDTTYNPGKNQETRNLTINVGNNNSFLDNIESPLGFSLNNNFSWKQGDFNTRDDIDFGLDRDELSGTNTSFSLSTGSSINLPSGTLRNKWQSSYGLLSLLPYMNLGANYTIAKYTSPEMIKKDLYAYDRHSQHAVSGSSSINHNGENFLFIDDLNTVNSASLGFSYDLKPEVSNDMELPVELDRTRFQNISGAYTFSMKYHDIFQLNNSFNYIFFDVVTKDFTNYVQNNNLNMTVSLNDVVDNWAVKLTSINISYNWAYYFKENQYTSDNMNINFTSSLSLFKGLFSMNMSFSLKNDKSYLYFQEKADFVGAETVNIFDDIFNTMGLRGIEGLQKGLFKTGGFNLSLSHDLREWYLSFSYAITPVNVVNSGSLKGFYFDQRISLDINLKQEFNPNGEGRFVPVDPINENLSPEVLR